RDLAGFSAPAARNVYSAGRQLSPYLRRSDISHIAPTELAGNNHAGAINIRLRWSWIWHPLNYAQPSSNSPLQQKGSKDKALVGLVSSDPLALCANKARSRKVIRLRSGLKAQLEAVLNLTPDVTWTLANDFAEVRRVVEIHHRIIPVDMVRHIVGFDAEL